MQYVWWERGCVPMSDALTLKNTLRGDATKKGGLHCGCCGARFSNWEAKAAFWFSKLEAGRRAISC